MRVLLDTTYIYRLATSPERFAEIRWRFADPEDTRFYASAVSIWEMRLKYRARHASGERKSPHNPEAAIELLERQGVPLLPVTPAHAAAELETPIPHKDPFDEMLLVQAQEEGMRLLTVDRLLADHPLALSA